ncbi:hypothetical protein TRFO_22543 [Tritrichomonas foetus]|uniref:Uncharacterized protein n=1 Tax=Tritrichomonas foetus TaxID=1144522 RepID=A0A1J4KBT1_9EUKA|nr:hypothetical protein TRFO_22543 [Tritrichomonas foetus]|eukprot:OHT08863.1 hypothetical protein TRFO_22543 [Tritrichomonas foetus]
MGRKTNKNNGWGIRRIMVVGDVYSIYDLDETGKCLAKFQRNKRRTLPVPGKSKNKKINQGKNAQNHSSTVSKSRPIPTVNVGHSNPTLMSTSNKISVDPIHSQFKGNCNQQLYNNNDNKKERSKFYTSTNSANVFNQQNTISSSFCQSFSTLSSQSLPSINSITNTSKNASIQTSPPSTAQEISHVTPPTPSSPNLSFTKIHDFSHACKMSQFPINPAFVLESNETQLQPQFQQAVIQQSLQQQQQNPEKSVISCLNDQLTEQRVQNIIPSENDFDYNNKCDNQNEQLFFNIDLQPFSENYCEIDFENVLFSDMFLNGDK